MKTSKFNQVSMTMSRASGYGHYVITATYRGKQLQAHTTDSEAWDYLDDDSDKERHRQAKKHCYNKILNAYINL